MYRNFEFENGQWIECEDRLQGSEEDEFESFEKMLERNDFNPTSHHSLGNKKGFEIDVFVRFPKTKKHGRILYLVRVYVCTYRQMFYVKDTPELMGLLHQWATIAHAEYFTLEASKQHRR